MYTSESDLQYWNASPPIVFTLPGIVMLLSCLQYSKALEPMLSVPSGMMNSSNFPYSYSPGAIAFPVSEGTYLDGVKSYFTGAQLSDLIRVFFAIHSASVSFPSQASERWSLSKGQLSNLSHIGCDFSSSVSLRVEGRFTSLSEGQLHVRVLPRDSTPSAISKNSNPLQLQKALSPTVLTVPGI